MEVVKCKIMRIGTENDLSHREKKALEIYVTVHMKDKTLKKNIMSCINEELSEETKNNLIKRIEEVEMDDRMIEVKENKLLLYRYVKSLRSKCLTMRRYEKMRGFGLKTNDAKIIDMISQYNVKKLYIDPKVVSELLEYISKNMGNNNQRINEVDDIVSKERKIDNTIWRYILLDANNPVEQIHFIKYENVYRLIHLGTLVYNKELSVLVKMLKDQLMDVPTVRWVQPIPYKILEHEGRGMILYKHESKIYFEVNHTLNIFGYGRDDKKYAECKKMSIFREMRNNVHGGFYVKMYLSEDSMYKIFMKASHNVPSQLIKLIKTEMSNVKCDNKIVVDKNEFQSKNMNNVNATKTYIDKREELKMFINQKIQECKKLKLENYKGIPTLYMCIIDILSAPQSSKILCKIGYSKNVQQRMYTLKQELMCSEINIIGVVANCDCKYERRIHKSIKSLYPTLHKPYYILNHYAKEPQIKTEVYIFEKKLYEYLMYQAIKKSQPDEKRPLQLKEGSSTVIMSIIRKKYCKMSESMESDD